MGASPIPAEFIRRHVSLSWYEAHWGYQRQLTGWSAIVDLATDRLLSGSNDPAVIELAGLTKTEAHRVGDLLRDLAEASKDKDLGLAKRKWLYLVLTWLYENQERIDDPLGEVEIVYADFDYPAEIEGFVRYMPPRDGYDPARHTRRENRERMMGKWRQFLDSLKNEMRR